MRRRVVGAAAVGATALGAWLVAASVVAGAPRPADLAIRLPAIRDVTLPNGGRLLLAERHDVPLISFMAYIRGGSVADPPGKEGLASLTAEMLRRGAGARSARDLADAVDGVGGDLATASVPEVTYVSGEFMSRDRALMLDVLRSILREPTFPDSELVKVRAQTVEALTADKEDPGNVYRQYGATFFYGAHPYGRPTEGDESTVARLTRDDVLRAYRERFGGDRLILAMVGDFSAAAMESALRSAFGDWKPATAALPDVPEPAAVHGRRVLLVDKPGATQCYFTIVNRGMARTDPDRDVADVANAAFGGRYSSLLNTALRIKSGLTYGASCRLARLAKGGSLTIASYTKTESTARAVDLALATLRSFRARGIDRTEVTASRNYINGQFPTDLETAGQLAGRLASDAFYGLGRDEIAGYPVRIAAVDSAEVRGLVGRLYPSEKDAAITLVGDASKLRSVARRYGPVTEISITRPMIEAVRAASAGRPATAR